MINHKINAVAYEAAINQALPTIAALNYRETAIAILRYEALRTLEPREYTKLCARNISGGVPFDHLVDEIIAARAEESRMT